jgi:acyl carrier protein
MGLDAVEIVMGWESAFGITIADKEAFDLRNTRQAVALIAAKVGAEDRCAGACLTHQAFNRLRSAFVSEGVPRSEVRPSWQVHSLLTRVRPSVVSPAIQRRLRLPQLPLPLSWASSLLSINTVESLVNWIVVHHPRSLFEPEQKWTSTQVRQVVRAVVVDVIGAPPDYPDDADFVHDLGVD